MRCWQCGVEPLDVIDVTGLGDPQSRFMASRWPVGDHEHEVHPPTPGELAARGDAVMARIARLS